MGWEHTAREKRLAPTGQYRPERHRVVIHDTFQQYRLSMAALILCRRDDLPELLLFCAEYTLSRHPLLKRFRSVFRKGARQLQAAAAAPVDRAFREPESERERRIEEALGQFRRWAGSALREEITGETYRPQEEGEQE